MLETRKSVIKFNSSDGVHQIAGYFLEPENKPPRAVLQISHGMCEYFERYTDFAEFLVQHGYAVCGNDHLGHGDSTIQEHYGFFAEKDGYSFVLRDLYQMNKLAHCRYPQIPVLLLGHSMGSFFARQYAVLYPESINGLLIVGTGGPNRLSRLGQSFLTMLIRKKGAYHRSPFSNRLIFGAYLKKVSSPKTPYDWISRDTEIVARYAADARCTFLFTASAFYDLLTIQEIVNRPQWARRISVDLPVILLAGDHDPVGNYGKGVKKVYEMLCRAGVRDIKLKLYHKARHEIINETNRTEVYQDILSWCDQHIGGR